jgi:hypothetical protein
MVTYNPAVVLHVDNKIGSLKPGLFGDIAIYDGRGKNNPYRTVIEANAKNTVLVLRRSSLPFPFIPPYVPEYVGSVALYGDQELLQLLPSSLHEIFAGFPLCEPMDVCGEAKLLCPLRETWWWPIFGLGDPLSIASLVSANADSYPLFFCGEPLDEPTCVPLRPGEYDGSITKGAASRSDRDGDGIKDNKDNCKNVFNPIRPMDSGVQADADGDGIGDACDKCPSDACNHCTAVDPYTGETVYIGDWDDDDDCYDDDDDEDD